MIEEKPFNIAGDLPVENKIGGKEMATSSPRIKGTFWAVASFGLLFLISGILAQPRLLFDKLPLVPMGVAPVTLIAPSNSLSQATQVPGRLVLVPVELATPSVPASSPAKVVVVEPIEVTSQAYRDEKDGYSFNPPDNWTSQLLDGREVFSSPSQNMQLVCQVFNPGIALDEVAFARFVQARESVEFYKDSLMNTEQPDRNLRKEANGSLQSIKTLVKNGIAQTILSKYQKSGERIIAIDLSVAGDDVQFASGVLDSLFSSIKLDDSTHNQVENYSHTWSYQPQGKPFILDIPVGWTISSVHSDFATIDVFTSPDEQAVFQVIVYDDKEEVSRSVAGAFALSLLRNYYGKNIVVTENRLVSNGTEKLTWAFPSDDYKGVTYFGIKGTALIMYGGIFKGPSQDLNQSTIERIAASYHLPD